VSAATGNVRTILRVEGLAILAAATFMYHRLGFAWPTFFWFFLLPDLSFAGYLLGPRIGAIAYNLAHSYVGAVGLTLFGAATPGSPALIAGLIWLAHIGFDRALGYGLKYAQGFGHTHLGRVGKLA
jgi:hypothetical protein